ncbi:MAG: LacI family DNA-binding transcriptional regulator [Phycisphaerae bacterium]|nr:LacI family DNA-binding transcriptional regulator [Phycisphaerae bacterium]
MAQRKIKNVTLRDIAKLVGVSAMTVSRALSDKAHLVSAETVERCRQAAEEMGYVPNLMARSLRGEQLHTIVMFAEYISSHHYLAELVDLVSRSIEHRKFGVISCQSITSLHQAMGNFKLAGAVVIAPPEEFFGDPFGKVAANARRQDPTVVIHSAFEQDQFNEVSPDIAGFNHQAACHLIELGHRHIGYLGGARPEDEPHWFDLRRRSVEEALAEHNIPAANLRYQASPDAELAHAALQQLLTRAPQTTAVMCINDEIAIATVAGARKLGLRVPRDLSVIGCNDIKLAGFFHPPLTTLAIDIRSMVETALDLLFDEIRDQQPTPHGNPIKIKLPAKLIVRDSTGPPPSK